MFANSSISIIQVKREIQAYWLAGNSRPRTGADLRRAITMEDADYAEI